ncbi:MAG: LytTR family transcriptional regulator, partial [Dorea sp.]|nr:LytTR family transcriptional regulator [Dorea sp.]
IFVRCHNSFIVNFMAVREFTRTDFVLNDESIIPISRYKLNETRERFFVWSKQYI